VSSRAWCIAGAGCELAALAPGANKGLASVPNATQTAPAITAKNSRKKKTAMALRNGLKINMTGSGN
jgi:hypothetical protein